MPIGIREALATDQLYVALQPVVDYQTRRAFAYEALVRGKVPELASPPAIIQAAIEARCLGELGRFVRTKAVAACPTDRIFINIHPGEFDEGWLVRPDDPIFERDIYPAYLEITESVPLSHFDVCHSVLSEIRNKGVRLVIDDLGAGYSNLKYIADLSPDVVKLDRELVTGLHQKGRMEKLVTSIVRLCTELGAKVVAEGIETDEELRAVLRTGVHYMQGYLFAKPAFPAPPIHWPEIAPE